MCHKRKSARLNSRRDFAHRDAGGGAVHSIKSGPFWKILIFVPQHRNAVFSKPIGSQWKLITHDKYRDSGIWRGGFSFCRCGRQFDTVCPGRQDCLGGQSYIGHSPRAKISPRTDHDRRKADIGSPLYPQKRKSRDVGDTSALCQKRKSVVRCQ